jgi:hypothetical protein
MADTSWIAIGEWVYVDNASGAIAGQLQVQSKTSTSVTLLNPAQTQLSPSPPLADATRDGLLRKVSGTITDYVGGDNVCRPLPVIPVADATQNGLLRQVSGNITDYVGGDNVCHPLPAATLASSSIDGLLKKVSGLTTDFVDGSNNCQGLSAAVSALLATIFGPWTPFTLTATSSAGSITTQTSNSSYLRIGKTVFLNLGITISNIGTASGSLSFSGLPVAIKRSQVFYMRETAINGLGLSWTVNGPSGQITTAATNGNIAWANGNQYYGQGVYEAA